MKYNPLDSVLFWIIFVLSVFIGSFFLAAHAVREGRKEAVKCNNTGGIYTKYGCQHIKGVIIE